MTTISGPLVTKPCADCGDSFRTVYAFKSRCDPCIRIRRGTSRTAPPLVREAAWQAAEHDHHPRDPVDFRQRQAGDV